LGATLHELLEKVGGQLDPFVRAALAKVAARAVAPHASARFFSADELATELRRAAKLPSRERVLSADASWPILGIDAVASELLTQINALAPQGTLAVEGPKGAGKSALLRRAAWSLGVSNRAVAWIEASSTADVVGELKLELSGKKID